MPENEPDENDDDVVEADETEDEPDATGWPESAEEICGDDDEEVVEDVDEDNNPLLLLLLLAALKADELAVGESSGW